MRRLVIGQRTIDERSNPYVIAEIGVNHEGSMEKALELIENAEQLRDALSGRGVSLVFLRLARQADVVGVTPEPLDEMGVFQRPPAASQHEIEITFSKPLCE